MRAQAGALPLPMCNIPCSYVTIPPGAYPRYDIAMNEQSLTTSNQMADGVERAAASLVTVNGRERQSATGIVFGPELVLTADHVLHRDDNLSVRTPDGRVLPAILAGRDAASDVAVLRVPGLAGTSASAAANARVGQIAIALGRPESDGVQASGGIITAVSGPARIGRGAQLERFYRTDATPYPGFSGGALIDPSGAVYGLMTTGLARGVLIVIPLEIALGTARMLAEKGFISRGFLGVVTQQVKLSAAQRAGAQESGLLVVRVEEDGPAEHGGVLVGDILTAIDGHPVADADDLLAALSGERVGRAVPVQVMRGGAVATVTVTIGRKQ